VSDDSRDLELLGGLGSEEGKGGKERVSDASRRNGTRVEKSSIRVRLT